MSVPVQTWGSLGTMVAEQREFGAKSADFLESNEVYDLFGHLLKQVVINQPENPIKFLQEQLRQKPPLCVCVIGPPGINRSKYCQQMAADFKIKHIHVGKLLRGPPAKKELTDILDQGALVDDDSVIKLVKAEIAKAKGGWVLDGFPRTKVQAQALCYKAFPGDMEIGICVDKVLLLHTAESVIRQRYAAKVAAAGYSASDKEDIINTRLQQYQRHVISIAELFKNVVRQIEVSAGDDDQNVIYGIIKSNLHVRAYSNAPLRSHRLCVVGPPGSGRTTQCKAIARNYGIVHVDIASLLRDYQQESGANMDEVPPEYVSDEEICAVVGRRLNEIDCLRKGWILDGFPKTRAQAEFLRESHLWPTRLIQLKLSEDNVLARLASRRIDPASGAAFYKPPQSVEVRQRLIQAEYDLPAKVKERYTLHQDNVDRVVQSFAMVASPLAGEEDISVVTKALCDKIDTALPSELAQDPEQEA